MSMHPYHRKLDRVLSRMGALYTSQDILTEIAAGRMQSFVEGDSWAITRIGVHPRARVLEVVAAVGDINECRILHDRILDFARDEGISVIKAYGRRGWLPDAAARGWKIKAKNYVYQKEM